MVGYVSLNSRTRSRRIGKNRKIGRPANRHIEGSWREKGANILYVHVRTSSWTHEARFCSWKATHLDGDPVLKHLFLHTGNSFDRRASSRRGAHGRHRRKGASASSGDRHVVDENHLIVENYCNKKWVLRLTALPVSSAGMHHLHESFRAAQAFLRTTTGGGETQPPALKKSSFATHTRQHLPGERR